MRLREITEGVGRITKQNQTHDVGPDEVTKQAAKFGNKVDKDGRPPTLSKKVKGSSTNVLFNLGLSEGYKLQLERDKELLVLHIKDTATGKRTEVRGKPGYETNYDPNDSLHILLDKVGKSANISELMNGEVVTINPKHPDADRAKAATDKAYSENFADGKVEEGPKDYDDMKLDAKGKQDSIDYFYKVHAPSMGKPVKAGKLGSHDIVTVTKGPTTLMFLVDANDSAVFYVAFDKYQDGVAIGNVRSNGTVKATDVYAYLVKKYGKLYSDAHQTPSGRKIWDNLSKYTKLKVTDVGDRLVATENFADGKKKGKSRPGRVKRSGASCNGSVTALRKRAKNASGEKAKMYHWCANMKSGRKKK